MRTALATVAAGRGTRRCTPETKPCDFWAWGEGNVRPPCCTEHMLELAVFVDELLTRHGILHWLDYGTLLGAVRNGELIPWDEDVDFGILARDVDAVRALRPEIEAAGHWLDDSDYPGELRIQLSKTNNIPVDLFVWADHDGLLTRPSSSEWDWPGMQDRVTFPASFLDPTGRVLLHGRAYPAPRGPHDFLRLHRYGENYLAPQRTTELGVLHFDVVSTNLTPRVESLLAAIADREQRLLAAVRSRSLVCRMQLCDLDSGRWWMWTALPFEPAPGYVERALGGLLPEQLSPTEQKLVKALAWLDQAIDEYERSGRAGLVRTWRRGRRLAQAFGRRARGKSARPDTATW
jgi:LicD family